MKRAAVKRILTEIAVVMAAAATLAIALSQVGGCATPAPLPFCAKWSATVVQDDDGDVIGAYLDVAGIEQLQALIQGLAAGTCRLPKKGTPV